MSGRAAALGAAGPRACCCRRSAEAYRHKQGGWQAGLSIIKDRHVGSGQAELCLIWYLSSNTTLLVLGQCSVFPQDRRIVHSICHCSALHPPDFRFESQLSVPKAQPLCLDYAAAACQLLVRVTLVYSPCHWPCRSPSSLVCLFSVPFS